MGYTYDWTVGLRDVDCFGVIFYTRPLEALQTAIECLFRDAGVPYQEIANAPWSAPVVHVEIDYRQRLELGDTVEIEIVPELGEHSFTFGGRGRHDDEVAFSSDRTQVAIDDETGDPMQVPELIADALRPHTE